MGFDPSIPSDQQALLSQDLQVLGGIPQGPNGDTNVLEVSQYGGAGFNAWLSQRIRYFIGENFNFSSNLPEPYGSLFPTQGYNTLAQYISSDGFSSAFGANIGAEIFTNSQNATYTLNVAGNQVPVYSPRVGVVMVTNLLFYGDNSQGSRIVQSDPSNSLANSVIRLTTIMHEGRHDDGNNTNVTFPHTSCDNGYSTKKICDASLNGPNAVGYQFLNFAYNTYSSNWNYTEMEKLRAVLADVQGRINYGAVYNDITPVGQ